MSSRRIKKEILLRDMLSTCLECFSSDISINIMPVILCHDPPFSGSKMYIVEREANQVSQNAINTKRDCLHSLKIFPFARAAVLHNLIRFDLGDCGRWQIPVHYSAPCDVNEVDRKASNGTVRRIVRLKDSKNRQQAMVQCEEIGTLLKIQHLPSFFEKVKYASISRFSIPRLLVHSLLIWIWE
jgi:hypothetical protein